MTGLDMCWNSYRRHSETSDHDHCEFCGAKFAEPELIPDALHVGYATADEYRWVCEECFDDFRERFGWNVVRCEERIPRS